jgi:hypothetical protein
VVGDGLDGLFGEAEYYGNSVLSKLDRRRGLVAITLGILAFPLGLVSIIFSLFLSVTGYFIGKSANERKQKHGNIGIFINLIAILIVFIILFYYISIGKAFLDPYITG